MAAGQHTCTHFMSGDGMAGDVKTNVRWDEVRRAWASMARTARQDRALLSVLSFFLSFFLSFLPGFGVIEIVLSVLMAFKVWVRGGKGC